jgi:hypothetical protein
LSDRLRNICYVQGLVSDQIQTIVRGKNYRHFDKFAETALVEKSAIISKQDRYGGEGSALLRCGSCGRVGHSSNKCFAREKRVSVTSSFASVLMRNEILNSMCVQNSQN